MDFNSFAPVAIFIAVGILFVLVTLFIAKLIRPSRPSEMKTQNYECGEAPIGSSWIRFNPRFYLFALLFVIFDVEAVFLFPWAVAYRSLGVFALVEMLIFIFVLLIGLFYAWKKGVLKWV